MSPLLTACKTVVFCGLAAGFLTVASAQVFEPQGDETPISGGLPGDQVFPAVGFGSGGGYAVWQDSKIDRRGQGVAAVQLDSSLQPAGSPFIISQRRVGHQERPSVAMLTSGGAAFAWQGGERGTRDIFARFIRPDGTFLTGDIQANPKSGVIKSSHYFQFQGYKNNALRNLKYKMSESVRLYRDRNQGATVTALPDGGALVAYSGWRRLHTNWMEIVRVEKYSRGRYITNDLPQKFGASQDWMLDVFFQRFSADGKKVGSEVLVNQNARYNQRDVSVAVLPNNGFVVVWVSENFVFNIPPVDAPLGPANATQVDIMARLFSAEGVPLSDEFKVNAALRPSSTPVVSALSDGRFTIVWAGRDGIRSNGWDIFARVYSPSGTPQDDAFRLNEHTYGDQFAPQISSVGMNQLVVWSSLGQDKVERVLTTIDTTGHINTTPTGFSGSVQSVYGRLLTDGVPAEPEFRVSTNAVKRLHPQVTGYSSAGAPAGPVHVGGLVGRPAGRFFATWSALSGLSGFDLYSKSFNIAGRDPQFARQAAVGVVGADSASGTGGANGGPALVGGSASSGTAGWQVSLSGPPSKLRLNWRTEAGARYQVQTSTDLRHWTDLAVPRVGTGASDSMGVEANGVSGYFRVLKLP